MLELTQNGLSYRWSALTSRERRDAGAALGCFAVAGFIAGFLVGFTPGRGMAPELLVPLSLLPMLPLAGGVLFLRRLGRAMDEFHWKMDRQAVHLGVRLFLLIATPLALMDGIAGVVLLPGWGYVLLLYACLVASVVVVARRMIGTGEA